MGLTDEQKVLLSLTIGFYFFYSEPNETYDRNNKKISLNKILDVKINNNGDWDKAIVKVKSVNKVNNLDSKDWVGIYKLKDIPGKIDSIRWGYINNDQIAILNEGVRIDRDYKNQILTSGKYIIHLFEDDGYIILDSKTINIR